MKSSREALWLLLLLLLPLAASAQESFYVDFQLQSGNYAPPGDETIVGSITLAPGTTGVVPDSAISGYSFSSTPGDPFAFSTRGTSPSGSMGPGLFSVRGNDLVFTPLPWVAGSPCGSCDNNPYQLLSFGNYAPSTFLDFQGPGLTGYPAEHGGAGPSPPGLGVAFDSDAGFQSAGWILAPETVIGRASSAISVPEVGVEGAMSALTLLAGILALLGPVRRRAQQHGR